MTIPAPVERFEPAQYLGYLRTMLRLYDGRAWLLALLGGVGTALLVAIPAALIDNPVFGRDVDPRTQDYIFLAVTAVLGGLIIASFSRYPAGGSEGRATAGGFLSFLAVGCPVCNKIAVAALGTSGALSIFGPAQLIIGVVAVVLLVWTLLLRARAVVGACSVA